MSSRNLTRLSFHRQSQIRFLIHNRPATMKGSCDTLFMCFYPKVQVASPKQTGIKIVAATLYIIGCQRRFFGIVSLIQIPLQMVPHFFFHCLIDFDGCFFPHLLAKQIKLITNSGLRIHSISILLSSEGGLLFEEFSNSTM